MVDNIHFQRLFLLKIDLHHKIHHQKEEAAFNRDTTFIQKRVLTASSRDKITTSSSRSLSSSCCSSSSLRVAAARAVVVATTSNRSRTFFNRVAVRSAHCNASAPSCTSVGICLIRRKSTDGSILRNNCKSASKLSCSNDENVKFSSCSCCGVLFSGTVTEFPLPLPSSIVSKVLTNRIPH